MHKSYGYAMVAAIALTVAAVAIATAPFDRFTSDAHAAESAQPLCAEANASWESRDLTETIRSIIGSKDGLSTGHFINADTEQPIYANRLANLNGTPTVSAIARALDDTLPGDEMVTVEGDRIEIPASVLALFHIPNGLPDTSLVRVLTDGGSCVLPLATGDAALTSVLAGAGITATFGSNTGTYTILNQRALDYADELADAREEILRLGRELGDALNTITDLRRTVSQQASHIAGMAANFVSIADYRALENQLLNRRASDELTQDDLAVLTCAVSVAPGETPCLTTRRSGAARGGLLRSGRPPSLCVGTLRDH